MYIVLCVFTLCARFGVSVDTYTTLLPPTLSLNTLNTVMAFIRDLNRWSFAGKSAGEYHWYWVTCLLVAADGIVFMCACVVLI